MSIIAADWNGTKVDVATDDLSLNLNATYPNFVTLIEVLPPGSTIVAEKTLESYELPNRLAVQDALKVNNILLLVFHPKYTARRRKELGVKKTDANDAKIILDIANHSIASGGKGFLQLKKFTIIDPNDPIIGLTKTVKDSIRNIRREKIEVVGKKGKTVIKKRQELLAEEVSLQLPKVSSLTPDQQITYTSSGKYKAWLIVTILVTASVCSGRNQFERICGLNQEGYGSIMRSNFYKHGWAHAVQTGKIAKGKWQNEIRRLYHWINNLLKADPSLANFSS